MEFGPAPKTKSTAGIAKIDAGIGREFSISAKRHDIADGPQGPVHPGFGTRKKVALSRDVDKIVVHLHGRYHNVDFLGNVVGFRSETKHAGSRGIEDDFPAIACGSGNHVAA